VTRRAYIALGANLGDARATVEAALAALERLPATRVVARSSLYRSTPLDAEGPDFVNAVAAVDTELDAPTLLEALHAIEAAHGRKRPFRNAPRTLDLDLLIFDDLVCASPELTLPHPRLHERAFVVVPLAEIAPQLVAPGLAPLDELRRAVAGQRLDKLPP